MNRENRENTDKDFEDYLDKVAETNRIRQEKCKIKMIIESDPDSFALKVDDMIDKGYKIVGSPFVIQGSARHTSYSYTSYSPSGAGTVRQNLCCMMQKDLQDKGSK